MPRFWLTYCDSARRLLGVVILDSRSLIEARLQALVAGTDRNAELCEGHELDDKSTALVPPDAIGRMLSLKEASSNHIQGETQFRHLVGQRSRQDPHTAL